MEYNEFRNKVLKAVGPHNFKITNSYKLKDAWRWIKKNKWLNIGQPVTEAEFGIIVKTINKHLQDQLIEGKDVTFPCRMGRLELRKKGSITKIKEGKVVTNKPIDWHSTLKLWWEDEECYNNRTLVRHDIKEIFGVYYNKRRATYNNKSFYHFSPIREIKIRLNKKISNEGLDAPLISKYYEVH